MNKTYQYQVYAPTSETRYNRVWQGDFEGEFIAASSNHWKNYWGAYNSGPTIDRTRKDNYLGASLGNAAYFNGYSSFLMPRIGQLANQFKTRVAAQLLVNPDSGWTASSPVQDIIGSYYMNASTANGWGISINFVAGQLSAIVGLGGASFTTASYALSSISAGKHTVGMQYDGTTLTLYLDGAVVATQATAGSIAWGGTLYYDNGPTIGAGFITTYQGTPTNNWFKGTLELVQLYCITSNYPATAYATSFFTAFHNNYSVQGAPIVYTFDDLPLVISTAGTLKDQLLSTAATTKNVTVATSTVNNKQSLTIVTSTGGSATQGVALSTNKPAITGGQTYVVSAYVKAVAGKTLNLQIQPVGGGSNASTSIVTDGTWQRISLKYTTNVAATNLEIDVFMSSANASIQTFWVDAIMLEDGTKLNSYWSKDSVSTAGATYSGNYTLLYHKAVIATWTYVSTWTDVVSDFKIAKEINNSGSQVSVTLARTADNFGERSDIDFNNRVDVRVINDTYVNGKLIFSGFIADYQPIYGEVEQLEVILFSYGDQLNQTMIESGVTASYDKAYAGGAASTAAMYAGFFYCGQTFTTSSKQTTIANIVANGLRYASVYSPTGAFTAQVKIWDSLANAKYDFYGNNVQTPYIAEAKVVITSSTFGQYTFTFVDASGNPLPVQVQPSTRYWLTFTVDGYGGASDAPLIMDNTVNLDTGEYYFDNGNSSTIGSTPVQYPAVALTLTINQNYGGTKVAYNSVDPSTILKRILDDYARQGGVLTYDSTTIEMTNTIVSYTFNTNTTFEGLKQVLAMTPADWYFYVDQATNKVHLHPKSSAPVHTLTLGKDLSTLALLKRTENIVNTIYFTGGPNPTNTAVNLFKQYVNSNSVALYGKRIQKITDNRVTVTSTMDLIAAAALLENSSPEVQTTIDIVDGNYDIEKIQPGDIIRFRGITNNGTSSLWDIGQWDKDYWDYDIATPETMDTQIARFDYVPDVINMTLNTTPPDVNKRVEDVKRNLDTTQVANNPNVAAT